VELKKRTEYLVLQTHGRMIFGVEGQRGLVHRADFLL
jgi:hypothetical protein